MSRTFAYAVTMGMVALIGAGIVWERIGQRQDRHRYPQIGRSVEIGGRTLNIFCSGEGGPVVVFDTFGHTSGFSWSGVQSQVAKFNRACWYDRAGYGWSDPDPKPRTFQSVASDLHKLLQAASVPPPYVLVGGGDAALHIRVYHGLYPSEVAGIVMVNANDVDDPQVEVPESVKGAWAKHFGSFAPRVRGVACRAFPTLAQVGLLRLAGLFQKPRPTSGFNLTLEQQAELDFLSDNPTSQRGSEMCDREESMEQVRAAGNLGDVPLIVIASRGRLPASNPAERAMAAAWNKHETEELQPALVRLSSRGRLVRLEGDVTADVITKSVREVIDNRFSPR
jgi:pimeloyl-ACP methyl ester carboxylesterase